MNIGTLEIELLANIARLSKDMDDAKTIVGQTAQKIQGHINMLQNAFAALAGVLAVGYFVNIVKSGIDAQEQLGKLSKQTGDSAAALLAFKGVGMLTGTSIDTIAAASVKMSKNFSDMSPAGKTASTAIQSLGINLNDFQKMNPDQRMLAVAGAMNKFKDGSEKTAAAVAIFGRSGAQILPFLDDLGKNVDGVSAKLTDQAIATAALRAEQAKTFGDNLVQIQKNQNEWKKDLTNGLLPALADITTAFVGMDKTGGGLKAQLKQMSDDGTLSDYLKGAAVAASYLVDGLQFLWKILQTLGKFIGTFVADALQGISDTGTAIGQVLKGDFSGAVKTMQDSSKQSADAWVGAGKDIANVWGGKYMGESFRESLDSVKKLGEGGKAAAADLGAAVAPTKEMIAAGDAFTKSIEGLNAQLKIELSTGAPLTQAKKEMIKLDSDLKSGKIYLTAAQLAHDKALIQSNEDMQDSIAAQKEYKKAQDEAIKKTYEQAKSIEDEAVKQREHNETLGMSKSQIDAFTAAQLRAKISTLEATVALEDQTGVCDANSDAHRALLKALQDLAAAKEDGVAAEAAKQASDEWKKTADNMESSLTDSLMRAFESGKGFGQAFKDTLVNSFKTMILKPTIQGIIGGVFGGGSMGAAASGSSGASAGGLGGVMGMVGMAKSAYGFLNGGAISSLGNGITSLGAQMGSTGLQDFGSGMAGGDGTFATSQGVSSAGGMAGTALGYLGGAAIGEFAGRKISGGYSAIGGQSGSSAVNIGTLVGALGGPIGAAIGGVIGGVVNRAFGMSAKKVGDSGIEGSLGGGDATGQTYADWKQKGGWFRKDKHGTDYGAIDDVTSQALDNGASAVYQQTKAWADALKLPGEKLASVTTDFKIKLGDDVAANQTAITKVFTDYQNSLAAQFSDVLTPFKKAGESFIDTMNRLVVLQSVSENLNQFGGIFSNIAKLSVDAKEQLIGFAGGIDALISKTQTFVDQYYSDGEKYGMQSKKIESAFTAIGVDGSQLQTKDQFRALLEKQDISTENGRKVAAALLDIAPAFAGVADYLKANALTLDQSAAQAPQVAILQSIFDQNKTSGDTASAMADKQDLTNNHLESIDDGVRSSGDAVVSAVQNMGVTISAAVSRALGAQAPAGRAVVAA